jgi:hypothetical protein
MIMAMFSLLPFVLLSLSSIQEYGTMINHNVWFSKRIIENQSILNICWIFLHSKTVEYFDTFFILLKGGSPIFLQKFHHFGAVWCWYLLVSVNASAAIIPTLFNSFVHSLMYFYYFLSVFDKRKVLSPFKPIMTSIQLIQFASGFYIGSFGYTLKHYQGTFNDKYMIASLVFLFYGFCLIMLFLQFYYMTYIHKKDVKDI